ncbi:MerR family transcriptional regulator [Terrisporobacter mayombei]|uniref:HTH-type transcriptional regulator AdhR n=1 Tax=Terrisporobacter mayombei TaxID=1541 RepID=A0ABY9Q319_9FIRM|nr:MerR family transcriptional regulator [Terrisporobacter mayombei]MCC3867699.1 MerR family transcriptional regulator [Terrisporobacter mayombei]WMT81961.1 HTH-type transcriptional regulator AdhR [Terrisporobacter mayombei]
MTITEVSKKYGLSADTLRYYERVGLIPTVNRNKSGVRDYTQEDCNWVEFIKCMRGAGLPIEVLIDYVTMFQQGDSTIDERKSLLVDQRKALAEKIEEMNKTLERLDYKIDLYEKGLIMNEKELREKNQ